MQIKSYSKINLSLRIVKKLSSGLHDIQSNVFLVDLFDIINIKKINNLKDSVVFKGIFSKNIKKKNNSVINTLKLLKELKIINRSYKVIVQKNIPVFSGLGGGTSNSAFLVKHFLKRTPGKKLISLFEKKIGSDFRLFLQNQSFQKNLKNVTKLKKKYKLNFVLVFPNIKCSTKDIYLRVKKFRANNKIDFSRIKNEDKFFKLINEEKNDLQKIVETKHEKIKKIINFIKSQEGCYLSRMTGSGSVCFGLFKSKKVAKLALNRIKIKYPRYWSKITKTI
tara:strand:- start:79 stop:915 length:837 start_codon:yes stop_codon:yes gene_type:complete